MSNTDPSKTGVNEGSHESKQFPSLIKIITAATMQQILLYNSIELKHIMYGRSYVRLWSGQPKDLKIGIYCFSDKHVT